MSGSWPPAGAGGPPPVAGAQRTAMLISAVIGLIALVAVLCVALFTSDDSAGASFGLPGGGQTGGGNLGDPGNQNRGGVAVAGGSTGGSGGSSSSGGASVTYAQLKANFPLPPGARPSTGSGAGDLPPGEKEYDVRAGIASVKSFYDTKLKALGVEWPDPLTTTTTSNGKTRITGWHSSLYLPNDDKFDGFLQIDENPLGDKPGIVVIQVTLTELS